MVNLFTPPPSYDLPLSKGGDLVVDFVRVDDTNTPIPYDAGSTVTLTIDTTPPTVGTATISVEHALVKIESTAVDPIKKGVMWRCVVSLNTVPTTEIVARNGTTTRADK